MKRILAIVLALCMIFALAGCAKDRDVRNEHEQIVSGEKATEGSEASAEDGSKDGESEQVTLPSATSDDVELYVVEVGRSAAYVVNAYGQRANGYSLDKDGNILDRQGEIIVAADNAYFFRFLDAISFSEREYVAKLIAKEEKGNADDQTVINQYPTTITIFLTATPKDTTNGVIVLGSSNTGIAEIKANNNAKIIADGAFELEPGEIAIDVGTTGSARIVVTAKTDGRATISARSLSGTATAECIIDVQNGEIQVAAEGEGSSENLSEMINASEDPTIHTHSYTKTVVDPTPYEKGYTLYTCECGHSYKDNFTSPLPEPAPVPTVHVHEYSATVVAPTETERGYTLHVCQDPECGDSYKDCFVDPLGD